MGPSNAPIAAHPLSGRFLRVNIKHARFQPPSASPMKHESIVRPYPYQYRPQGVAVLLVCFITTTDIQIAPEQVSMKTPHLNILEYYA